ncbi:hypothetical protein K501DRAFT_331238 [Backusella circina FSU 941]|nr:hypothetical protein K501DRAFT_331238 [Backusella circina FSU 941]
MKGWYTRVYSLKRSSWLPTSAPFSDQGEDESLNGVTSKKKKQQQKAQAQAQAQAEAQAEAAAAANEAMQKNINKYKLDDISITHDFRSSVILPQLNKNLDTKQFQSLQDLKISSSSSLNSRFEKDEPTSPTSTDGSKQYEELAAWRHIRNQNRYSNGLFGGKQRGRPKPQSKKSSENTYQKSPLSRNGQAECVNDHEVSIAPLQDNEEEINQGSYEKDDSVNEQVQDFSLNEEPFEPDSDMEENYFFNDFSAEALSNQKLKIQNKKRRASAKANKKLNLSSFASELNASRLSVIQPRESRIVMTEEDELELSRLLELQKQRISIYNNDVSPTPSSSSPIPKLPVAIKQDLLNDGYKPLKENNSKRRSSAFDIRSIRKPFGLKESNIEDQVKLDLEQARTNNDIDYAPDTLQSVTEKPTVSSSNVSQLVHQQGSTLSLASSLKRSVSVNSTSSNLPLSPKMTQNHIQENASNHRISRIHNISGHRRSFSMDAMSVKLELDDSVDIEAWRWPGINKTQTNDIISKNSTIEPQVSRSLAGPLNKTNSDQSERDQEEEAETVHKEHKTFGIFGGLRSAARSRSNTGSVSIKGFVRNLSTTNLGANTKSEKRNERGMSRAAATALQHNDSKDELSNVKPSNIEETLESKPKTKKERKRANSRASNGGGAVRLLSQLLSRSSKQKKIVKTINVEEKAASDSKKRAQVVRRTIIYVQPDSLDFLKNTEDRNTGSTFDKSSAFKNDSFSPPFASNDGKIELDDSGLPSLASSNSSTSEGSTPVDDDMADPCALTTKKASQLSVKKNVDRTSDISKSSSQSNPSSIDKTSTKRSGRNDNRAKSQASRESHYMEGVELREMSDGSVVWGIVKKEGNRVSFFSPDSHNNTQYNCIIDEDQDEEDEDKMKYSEDDKFNDFEKNSRASSTTSDSSKNYNVPAAIPHYCLQPPPPIPKRSSLRRSPTTNSDSWKQGNNIPGNSTPPSEEASTADIYYADDITLPSLLRLMRDQENDTTGQFLDDDEYGYLDRKTAIPSVDEQLEEMMKSLTSHSELNRA